MKCFSLQKPNCTARCNNFEDYCQSRDIITKEGREAFLILIHEKVVANIPPTKTGFLWSSIS